MLPWVVARATKSESGTEKQPREYSMALMRLRVDTKGDGGGSYTDGMGHDVWSGSVRSPDLSWVFVLQEGVGAVCCTMMESSSAGSREAKVQKCTAEGTI